MHRRRAPGEPLVSDPYRILDLYCGAGGAAMGYHRAGFEVVGVDIKPQPHYPFEFHLADALEFPLEGFDAIHASPPCQAYSSGVRSEAARATPRMIADTRARLIPTGLPYVIENVAGAREELRATSDGYITLCGSMFGGDHARRHRLFEVWPWVWQPYHPECHGMNARLARRLGVDWRRVQAVGHGRDAGSRATWELVLGIDWMTQAELSQAIPPAYTEWLGEALLEEFARRRRSA